MSEPLSDPEHTPAMETSVHRLTTKALQLVDTCGAPAEIVNADFDNPNTRELTCSEEAVQAARLGRRVCWRKEA